jgi:hypothetical protein
LASKCLDCGQLYPYQHPAGRRDAYWLHLAYECPANPSNPANSDHPNDSREEA